MPHSCLSRACSIGFTWILVAAAHAQATAAQTSTGLRAPSTPAPLLRIMPLGDSITQGGLGHAGWRYPLWFLLDGGVPVDFVGSQSTCYPGDTTTNPDPLLYPDYHTTFDRDNEGHWARRTDQVAALMYAAALVSRPDIVLVHLGTNDVGQYGAGGLINVEIHLPRLFSHIRAVRPRVTILLAKIIPIGRGSRYVEMEGRVPAYNAGLEQLALQETTPASPVFIVDQNSSFHLGHHMQLDGLHPNVSGEQHMAVMWAAALQPHFAGHLPPPHPAAQVLESSFESLVLADGESAEWPAGNAWDFGATPNTSFGFYNPPRECYPGAIGDGTPIGADGADALYLMDGGSGNEAVVAYQTLATTLEPGLTYTLTVAVGKRLADNSYGPSTYGGFRVELLAGNDVIASAADTITPAAGTFQDVTISVASASVPARLLGQALTIRAGMTATAALSATDFDNVRLTVQ